MIKQEIIKQLDATTEADLFEVFIPSYRRFDGIAFADILKTFSKEARKRFHLVVREAQYVQYAAKYPWIDIIQIPSGMVDGVGSTRNFILKYCFKHEIKYAIDMDDDIKYLGFLFQSEDRDGKECSHSSKNEDYANDKRLYQKIFQLMCRIAKEAFEANDDLILGNIRKKHFSNAPEYHAIKYQINTGVTPRQIQLLHTGRMLERKIMVPKAFNLHGDDIGLVAHILQKGYSVFNIPCLCYDYVDDAVNSVVRDPKKENRELHRLEYNALMAMETKHYLKQSFSFDDGEYKFGDIAWRKFHAYKHTSPKKVFWEAAREFSGISHGYCSPRWSAELADCSLPMTLDTYSNCAFGCVYCFSQYQRGNNQHGRAENYHAKRVESINVKNVAEIFRGDRPSQFADYVRDKRAIQWGGLSDQFDGFERKYGKTLELMTELKRLDYPISFSTKSAWVFHDSRYLELFRGQKNWNVKFSIITLNEEHARKIEVGVPTPRERLEAMRIYSGLGAGGATLRLRPFIIGVSSNDYLELIEAAHKAGADAVTTEFFCLEMRSINNARENYNVISECCGFDIVDFYRKYSVGTGYLRLNRKIKEKYIKNMQATCAKLGMRFYVSDAHFKEACDGSCCCGLPESWNYSRGNFSYALQLCKKNGRVHFSEIDKDMYFLTPMFKGATGMNTNSEETRAKYAGMTLRDYLRYLWNNPNAGQSPCRMFERVMIPDGYDKNGDIIYRYNPLVTYVR